MLLSELPPVSVDALLTALVEHPDGLSRGNAISNCSTDITLDIPSEAGGLPALPSIFVDY